MCWILAIGLILALPQSSVQRIQFAHTEAVADSGVGGAEGSAGQRAGGMKVNTTQNKKIAEADVMNVGPERLAEKLSHYADDATVWDSVMRVLGFAQTNRMSGLPEVKRFFTWLAGLPPVKVKVLNVFGEGDKVAVEWMLQGGEGVQKFEIPCANIYDFENGKIKSVRMQFDSASFAQIAKK